jgi:hypothetical protein
LLVRSGDSGADTDVAEGCTAARRTVCVTQALASDELLTLAVSDIFGISGIG